MWRSDANLCWITNAPHRSVSPLPESVFSNTRHCQRKRAQVRELPSNGLSSTPTRGRLQTLASLDCWPFWEAVEHYFKVSQASPPFVASFSVDPVQNMESKDILTNKKMLPREQETRSAKVRLGKLWLLVSPIEPCVLVAPSAI